MASEVHKEEMIRLNNGVTKQFLLGAAAYLRIAARSARDSDSKDWQKLVSKEKTAAKGGEQWITGYSS